MYCGDWRNLFYELVAPWCRMRALGVLGGACAVRENHVLETAIFVPVKNSESVKFLLTFEPLFLFSD